MLLVAGAEDPIADDGRTRGWRGLPVTPALITWQIRSVNRRVVLGRQVAADFRGNMPNRSFWQVYARGTYQNMAVFGHHYSWNNT